MRLVQIDYFLEVADKLNFTQAANALYISQPALSKQIALLEEEIGTKLFDRSSRKVNLTPAGQQLRRDLLDIKRNLNAAIMRASEFGTPQTRSIKIGCFDARATGDFIPVLYNSISTFDPHIQIELSMSDFSTNMRYLKDESIDFMITLLSDYVPEPGYSYAKLAPRPTGLIYSNKMINKDPDKVTISDFADKTLLVPKDRKGHRLRDRIINTMQSQGIPNPTVLDNDNYSTFFLNLELGIGYSMMASEIASSHSSLRCFELGDNFNEWVIAVVKDTNTEAKKMFDQIF